MLLRVRAYHLPVKTDGIVGPLDIADDAGTFTRYALGLELRGQVHLDDAVMARAARDQLLGRVLEDEADLSPGVDTLLGAGPRRLLVAWTWPDPRGLSVPAAAVDLAAMNPSRVPQLVRDRVAAVATRLDSMMCMAGDQPLSRLAATVGTEHRARFGRLKSGDEPLSVEFLLNLSDLARLSFEPIGDDARWGWDEGAVTATLRREEDLRKEVASARERLNAAVQQPAHRRGSPDRLHAMLPGPPATVSKYRALFDDLDSRHGADCILSFAQIDAMLPTPTSGHGPHLGGLPHSARSSDWWVNSGHPGVIEKNGHRRAWLAAGYEAHVRSGAGGVVEIRFVAMQDRATWWPHRHALRAGTYQPRRPL